MNYFFTALGTHSDPRCVWCVSVCVDRGQPLRRLSCADNSKARSSFSLSHLVSHLWNELFRHGCVNTASVSRPPKGQTNKGFIVAPMLCDYTKRRLIFGSKATLVTSVGLVMNRLQRGDECGRLRVQYTLLLFWGASGKSLVAHLCWINCQITDEAFVIVWFWRSGLLANAVTSNTGAGEMQ